MANVKLTGQDELAETPASGDWFHIVDVSDTTDDAAGSSKKIQYNNLISGSTNIILSARKDSAGTISKGNPVYLVGYNASGYVTVEQADADDAAKMPSIGIAGEDITNSSTSQLVVIGELTGLDTSSWSVGDALYVQDDGTLGNTRPNNADDAVQKVAQVIKSNATTGIVEVVGAFRSNDIPNTMKDTIVRIVDDGDATKVIMFQASGITTGNTRTITMADADIDLANVPTSGEKTVLGNTSGTNTGDEAAADLTTAGVIEIATVAETDTGTDATRAVSPDGLAGSYAGTKIRQVTCYDYTTDCAVADGVGYVDITSDLNGMNLVGVQASVITAGTTGTMDIQVHNVTDAVDMLSTKITIDSAEVSSVTAATPAVINTSNDDVATGDQIRVDVDVIHTTAAKGLIVSLLFRLP